MLTIQSFFNLEDFPHRKLFQPEANVWQPLNDLKQYMDELSYPVYSGTGTKIIEGVPLPAPIVLHNNELLETKGLSINYGDTTKGKLVVKREETTLEGASVIMAGAVFMGKRIDIGKGVLIETGAMIKSPTIIGDQTEVRQGAYLRGYCLVGKRCVVGHTTEVKHSIFLNDAKAGHFAYLGDSIMGNDTNLGAGTKFANLRFLPGNVTIFFDGKRIDTGRKKFGAILGDTCQTGCNSVTSPGTIMAKGAVLLPNVTAKGGYHKERAVLR